MRFPDDVKEISISWMILKGFQGYLMILKRVLGLLIIMKRFLGVTMMMGVSEILNNIKEMFGNS